MATILASGKVIPEREVRISARIPGKIREILVKEGQEVTKDTVLLSIDSPELDHRIRMAKQDRDIVQKRLEEAILSLADAESELRREEERFKIDPEIAHAQTEVMNKEKILSQSKIRMESAKSKYERYKGLELSINVERLESLEVEYQVAEVEYQTAIRALEQARETLASLEKIKREQLEIYRNRVALCNKRIEIVTSELARADEALRAEEAERDKTIVRSPIDGIVLDVRVEVGETVIPGQLNIPGTELVTIIDESRMYVEADVYEKDYTRVKIGYPAMVFVDAYPERKFRGRVVEISSSAVRENTTGDTSVFKTKIVIEDDVVLLRPGLSCRAEIQMDKPRENILSVPIHAVLEKSASAFTSWGIPGLSSDRGSEDEIVSVVFVLEDGKARARMVKTGISDHAYVEITEGLDEGELVITGPYRTLHQLRDGTPVVPQRRHDGK